MVDKKAPAEHAINDVTAQRWSPRAFSDKKIEREKILALFEAARWAPSAFNEQPWRFIVASKDDPHEYERLISCLVEPNRVWAKNAPLVIALVVKTTFDRNGRQNRLAMHDCGLAMENLLLEATAQGLQGHPMAGFSPDKVRKLYEIPEGCEPIVMAVIGYPAEPDVLDEELKKRELEPRVRRAMETFVFSGRWDNPFNI